MSETQTIKCCNCGSPLVPAKEITLDGTLPLDSSWTLSSNEGLVCPKCHPEFVKEEA